MHRPAPGRAAAALSAPCRPPRRDEAEKAPPYEAGIGARGIVKRPAAAKGPAKTISACGKRGSNAGAGGACRVKYVPVTGGQHSDLLHRRVLSPVPAGRKSPIPHFSAARHALQPASLRARCPFGRILCRALVCISPGGHIIPENTRKAHRFLSGMGAKLCTENILDAQRPAHTLKVTIFYIFWEGLS